eukprot:jgi/Mesvir1/15842/Mv03390-RA.1
MTYPSLETSRTNLSLQHAEVVNPQQLLNSQPLCIDNHGRQLWKHGGPASVDPSDESDEAERPRDGETVAALKGMRPSIADLKALAKAELAAAGGVPSLEAVLHRFGAIRRSGACTQSILDQFIADQVEDEGLEESFYVCDLGHVVQRYQTWHKNLPRVHAFYAVKCNPDAALVATLASQGAGFDCASLAEMKQVLATGVPPSLIIFANPCKMASHIAFARDHGVQYMTYDSVCELKKIKAIHPTAKMVLRIRADDRSARCPLGVKYGAEDDEHERLLQAGLDLGVDIVGISFHVGSGSCNADAFLHAIRKARHAFDLAVRLGLPPLTLLDLGGGFSGGGRASGARPVLR